jgi:hypothetical protein
MHFLYLDKITGIIDMSLATCTCSHDRINLHDTTGNTAFAVRSNLCRASFIGRMAKKLSAVRRTKRTTKNLCRAF